MEMAKIRECLAFEFYNPLLEFLHYHKQRPDVKDLVSYIEEHLPETEKARRGSMKNRYLSIRVKELGMMVAKNTHHNTKALEEVLENQVKFDTVHLFSARTLAYLSAYFDGYLENKKQKPKSRGPWGKSEDWEKTISLYRKTLEVKVAWTRDPQGQEKNRKNLMASLKKEGLNRDLANLCSGVLYKKKTNILEVFKGASYFHFKATKTEEDRVGREICSDYEIKLWKDFSNYIEICG